MLIEDLVVDQNYRRSGIGMALVGTIEEYARKRGCAYIMLITDRDRAGSQRFYRSLGYETDLYCAFKKKLVRPDL